MHQRKGKIVTIYDVSVTIPFKCRLAQDKAVLFHGLLTIRISAASLPDGSSLSGDIKIPEIAHDTDPTDLTFEISFATQTNSADALRKVIRRQLEEKLKTVIAAFPTDLIQGKHNVYCHIYLSKRS